MISLIAGIFVIVTEKVSDPMLPPGLTTAGFHMIATMAEVFMTVNGVAITLEHSFGELADHTNTLLFGYFTF